MFWKKKKEKVVDTIAFTDANFDELVTYSKLPVLIDFWAPWCVSKMDNSSSEYLNSSRSLILKKCWMT